MWKWQIIYEIIKEQRCTCTFYPKYKILSCSKSKKKWWGLQLQYPQWHHSILKLHISFFSLCWHRQVRDWVTAGQRCWVSILAARRAQSNSTYPLQPSPQSKNYVIHKYAKHHAETKKATARSLCRIASGQGLWCSAFSRSGSRWGLSETVRAFFGFTAVYIYIILLQIMTPDIPWKHTYVCQYNLR